MMEDITLTRVLEHNKLQRASIMDCDLRTFKSITETVEYRKAMARLILNWHGDMEDSKSYLHLVDLYGQANARLREILGIP